MRAGSAAGWVARRMPLEIYVPQELVATRKEIRKIEFFPHVQASSDHKSSFQDPFSITSIKGADSRIGNQRGRGTADEAQTAKRVWWRTGQ